MARALSEVSCAFYPVYRHDLISHAIMACVPVMRTAFRAMKISCLTYGDSIGLR
jgi:hypothetical protein